LALTQGLIYRKTNVGLKQASILDVRHAPPYLIFAFAQLAFLSSAATVGPEESLSHHAMAGAALGNESTPPASMFVKAGPQARHPVWQHTL